MTFSPSRCLRCCSAITGLVKDEKTGQPVQGASVQLIASDGANMQTETGAAGDFKFSLRPEVDYIFLASKNGLPQRERERDHKGTGQEP